MRHPFFGWGSLLFVAGLAAVSPAGAGWLDRRTVRVANAAELLRAIGPDRTLVLAPGEYDLAAAFPASEPARPWALSPYVELLDRGVVRIHDVDGLRLIGRGAILGATAPVALHFENTRRLRLGGLTVGRAEMPDVGLGGDRVGGNLHSIRIVDSREVRVDDLRFLADHCARLGIEGSEARLRGLADEGGCGLEVSGPSRLLVEDATVDAIDASWLHGYSGEEVVRLEEVTLRADVSGAAGETLRSLLYLPVDGKLSFSRIRLIDRVTGRQLLSLEDRLPPPPAQRRRVPSKLLCETPRPSEDERLFEICHVQLPDGRLFEVRLFVDSHGHDPGDDAVSVEHLGNDGEPLLISWSNLGEGSYGYEDINYRIVGPSPGDDEPLLGDTIPLSGHSGWAKGIYGSLDIVYEHGLLTLFESAATFDHSEDGPRPGYMPVLGESELYHYRGSERRTVRVFRWTGGRLESVGSREYLRVEPGDDLGELLRTHRPTLPRPGEAQPRPGDWVTRR